MIGQEVEILKHRGGCTHQAPCEYIGKTGIVKSIDVKEKEENVVWVKLKNGVLAHFLESDLE